MIEGNIYDAAAQLQAQQPEWVFLFHFGSHLRVFGHSAHVASSVWSLPALRGWVAHLHRFEVEILIPNRKVYLTQLVARGHRVAIVQLFWRKELLVPRSE